jgi:sugar phosphate isomerase/epimerase
LRLGVNAISLPELTIELTAEAVAALGYTGIEWRVAEIPADVAGEPPSFWGNSLSTLGPNEEAIDRAKAACERHGLEVIGICPYVQVGDRAYLERIFRLARRLGAGQVRLYAPWFSGEPYGDLLAAAVEFFAHAEKVARAHGIKGAIEMHQETICPSAAHAKRLVDRFDPECIGVIYDSGNVVLEGSESPALALDILGEHLAHVHLKNAGWRRQADGQAWESYWAPLDEGIADIHRVLDLLQARAYEGWVAMEEFSTMPTIDLLRRNLQLTRAWIDSNSRRA